MKDIIIATSNLQKLKDFIKVNEEGGYHYNILSMNDINLNIDIDENGETYRMNAYIKAKAVHDLISKKIPVIADDCGYELEYLNNEPGVYSKRYLGDVSFKEKIRIILGRMESATKMNQRVMHRCGSVVCISNNHTFYKDFKLKGYCAYEVQGLKSKTTYDSAYLSDGNMPNTYEYSNIFYLPEYEGVMAELTEDEWYEINPRIPAIKQIYQSLLTMSVFRRSLLF